MYIESVLIVGFRYGSYNNRKSQVNHGHINDDDPSGIASAKKTLNLLCQNHTTFKRYLIIFRKLLCM